jgi:undecaprenyl phosphate-alpha-L-ara4N flippase subunit ArnE
MGKREDRKKKSIGIALMLLSSCCVCTGQLFWKLSVQGSRMYLCAGFLLYGAGAFSMLTAYKFGSLSTLQPMLCMQYVFAVLLARSVLGEAISAPKYIGIAVILISVMILGLDHSP